MLAYSITVRTVRRKRCVCTSDDVYYGPVSRFVVRVADVHCPNVHGRIVSAQKFCHLTGNRRHREKRRQTSKSFFFFFFLRYILFITHENVDYHRCRRCPTSKSDRKMVCGGTAFQIFSPTVAPPPPPPSPSVLLRLRIFS